MPRPEWSKEARGDLREVLRFIAADNPTAARAMKALFERKVGLLAEHPHLGPPGRVEGTRELHAHPSYRLVYAVAGGRVRILRLVHTGPALALSEGPGGSTFPRASGQAGTLVRRR